MKKTIFLFIFQMFCAAGFSQNLRFTEPFTIHIPIRADLDVRWNAPTNKFPARVWIYHLLPRPLPLLILSNLMAACSFTDQDKVDHGNQLEFKSADGNRMLQVFPPLGIMEYQTIFTRSSINLIKEVPSKRQALKLTEKFLSEIGINTVDIEKRMNNFRPNFYVFDMGVTYFINRKPIHNTEAREVRFRRAVDGISFTSVNTGGNGEIDFSTGGKITKISIAWRNMERQNSYPVIAPEMMVKSIREGKAIQGMIPENLVSINWQTVKKVTIKKAEPCYYAGGNPFAPSDWLEPYAALWTTVETGNGNIDVEIDCPMIDETNLQKIGQ